MCKTWSAEEGADTSSKRNLQIEEVFFFNFLGQSCSYDHKNEDKALQAEEGEKRLVYNNYPLLYIQHIHSTRTQSEGKKKERE